VRASRPHRFGSSRNALVIGRELSDNPNNWENED
jgi:hypothetical protein